MSERTFKSPRGRPSAPIAGGIVGLAVGAAVRASAVAGLGAVAASYRGVRLPMPVGRTNFSLDQIEKAVEDAIAKNADAITGGK